MINRVTLTEDEGRIIRGIAKIRHENNLKDYGTGFKSREDNSETDSIDIQTEGYYGEFAGCKMLGIFPNLSLHLTGHTPDGYFLGRSVDFKRVSKKYKRDQILLNVPPTQKRGDIDIYIIVWGDFPDYEIVGWTWERTVFQERHLQISKTSGKMYHSIPIRYLNPFDELEGIDD